MATRESSLTKNIGMTLTELLDRYTAANECSRRYVESLSRTVKKAESSGLKKICQLSSDAVNKFLAELPLGPTTRHNIRRELLTLWRFAYEERLIEAYPGRIRRIRPAYGVVRAWTPSQLLSMLSLAREDQTPISKRCGLRRCDVLPCWLLVNYDTGLRFSDVLTLSEDSLSNGCVVVAERKTGKVVTRRLKPETEREVCQLLKYSPDGTLFQWLMPRRRAFLVWRAFLDANKFGGSTKWFRRSAATQVHKEKRGAAKEFLRHSAEHLQYRHYIDMSQIDEGVSPPELSST